MNVMKMMKQAQELQAKAAKLQADLANRHYEAEAAGGQVKAVATGEGRLVSLKIDPALLKDDVELLVRACLHPLPVRACLPAR
jgi:DNA-binding protein YbaB